MRGQLSSAARVDEPLSAPPGSRAGAEPVRVAHGLRIEGLDDARNLSRLPAAQAADLPIVRVERSIDPCPPARRGGGAGWAGDLVVREFSGGRAVVLDRAAGTARFHGPAVAADVFAHPGLLLASPHFNHWAGRETFQAGAFTVGGRGYLVAGPTGSGKSVLLTALAAAGATVLTDAGATTDGRWVHSGPRTIDLAEPVPMDVVGLPMQPVRGGTHCRLGLGPAPLRRPLAGVLFLRWGGPVRAEPVGDAARAGRLAAQRTLRVLSAHPDVMAAAAALPAWNLHRPRNWQSLDEAVALILGLTAPEATVSPVVSCAVSPPVSSAVAAGPVPVVV